MTHPVLQYIRPQLRPHFVCGFIAVLLLSGMPRLAFARGDVPSFVPDDTALARALPEATFEALPGGFYAAFPAGTSPITETRYGGTFSRAAYLYMSRRESKGNILALTVRAHYVAEDEVQARQTIRLCAHLLRLHREHFGHDAVFPRAADTVDLYVNAKPPSPGLGGETRGTQVYLFAPERPQTSVQWVRTVAHEWGHLTLPAARGFTEPENDAAGYLGERLFLKWLREEQKAGKSESPDDGAEAAGLEIYYTRQVAPLVERFTTNGPDSPLLNGTGEDSMDYYIGAALAFDDAVGSRVLGRALFSIDGVRPRDLLISMQEALDRADSLTVRLPAWLPLPGTAFFVTGNAPGRVEITGRSPLPVSAESPITITLNRSGWKSLRAVSGEVQQVTLRRVTGPDL